MELQTESLYESKVKIEPTNQPRDDRYQELDNMIMISSLSSTPGLSAQYKSVITNVSDDVKKMSNVCLWWNMHLATPS